MSLSPRVWQRIAENRINAAIGQGEFDDLPGFGKPLDLSGPDDGEFRWLRAKARRESLSLLPPALELARFVESALQQIQVLREEAEVIARISRLNQTIRTANRHILWGPPSSTGPVDLPVFLGNWRKIRHRDPAS